MPFNFYVSQILSLFYSAQASQYFTPRGSVKVLPFSPLECHLVYFSLKPGFGVHVPTTQLIVDLCNINFTTI